MILVRRKDDISVLPMAEATRLALERMGIFTVGALFDADGDWFAPLGQARRLVEQMARGDEELGLLEWGVALPGRRGTLWWSLADGLLSVYGAGLMGDYTPDSPAPWAPFAAEIRRVEIGEAVENVGSMAFAGCMALKKATLSAQVRRLGAESFRGCISLEEVESGRELRHWRLAGEDQTAVGTNAFAGTPWQQRDGERFRVHGGVLVEYLGDESRVRIPEGVREIAPMAFEGKPLEAIELPKSLERIGTCAFRGTKLREVTLPKGLETVEEWAFSHIPTLERVIIHNKRMTAHRSSFAGTPVAGQSVPRDGRWPSLLALNEIREPGITAARRLAVGDNPEQRVGVPNFVTRSAWRRRLKNGEMLLRIIPDEQQRYVQFVDAFYIHPCYGLSRLRTEPCWGRTGCVEPWRDEEYRFDALETERVNLAGLRKPGKIRWYTMPYSRYSEYDKPLVLLEQWLRVHPEYEIRTLDQCLEEWWPGPRDAA